VDTAPYYAVQLHPGGVGTSGGLVTDEYARVLGGSDRPIAGLYATGNMTASVIGGTYPGAGASIVQTMVFGYAAARPAAAGRAEDRPRPRRTSCKSRIHSRRSQ
jgi:3-oxosteroid 1-dehydrogenase